ncbi:hypothetical protein [Ktedonobacter sp. SOSP1-52]|uniref:hypothetical protein n=1 Tax=Ktedonobacter sp. SOSP1-52 TaxID=2778366 RepID=UPI0019155E5E
MHLVDKLAVETQELDAFTRLEGNHMLHMPVGMLVQQIRGEPGDLDATAEEPERGTTLIENEDAIAIDVRVV